MEEDIGWLHLQFMHLEKKNDLLIIKTINSNNYINFKVN